MEVHTACFLTEVSVSTVAKAPAQLWTPAGLDRHSRIAEQPRMLRAFGYWGSLLQALTSSVIWGGELSLGFVFMFVKDLETIKHTYYIAHKV